MLAQDEARLLNHNYIGTEHILLGLTHEVPGEAVEALRSLHISLKAVRDQVEEIIGRGQAPPRGHMPFTPRAKKVLELSFRESLQLGHGYIGTEHVLLGLIREGEGVAAQILQELGADLNLVRQTVIQILTGDPSEMSSEMATRQELRAALNPPSPFDVREKVVLSRLLEGETTKQIASELGLSTEKVQQIIHAIIRKLKDA